MDPQRETELKLEFDPAHRDALLHAPAIRSADRRTDRLVSTYFDTPGHAVREQGYSLRVRCCGESRIQTVKSNEGPAAGLFARSEWERPVPGDTPVLDADSGPLLAAIGEEQAERLVALFVTDMTRVSARLSLEGAEIELAIDCGAIRAGDAELALGEVELELHSGPPGALFNLARRLDGYAPLRLGVRAKSERGYALADGSPAGAVKAEAIALDRKMSAAEAFETITNACVRQFRLNEAILLVSDDAEAVHQARVALRRLRAAFSLFKPLLARDDTAKRLRAGLRRLAGALGAVRDLDVLMERLGRCPDPALGRARRDRFGQVRAELESARTRLLMLDLAEWLNAGPWRGHADEPVRGFAAAVLGRERKRLRKAGNRLKHLGTDELHRVRIEAKKARYASEFFASLWEKKGQRKDRDVWLGALEKLQDRLGTINDMATGRRILAELGLAVSLPEIDEDALRGKAAKAFGRIERADPFWR